MHLCDSSFPFQLGQAAGCESSVHRCCSLLCTQTLAHNRHLRKQVTKMEQSIGPQGPLRGLQVSIARVCNEMEGRLHNIADGAEQHRQGACRLLAGLGQLAGQQARRLQDHHQQHQQHVLAGFAVRPSLVLKCQLSPKLPITLWTQLSSGTATSCLAAHEVVETSLGSHRCLCSP